MAAPKGNKFAGSRKNIPNKLTQAAREVFVQTLEGQVKYIEQAFAHVLQEDPAKYLELFAKYAQYFVPKKLDIQMDGKVITVIPPNKKS